MPVYNTESFRDMMLYIDGRYMILMTSERDTTEIVALPPGSFIYLWWLILHKLKELGFGVSCRHAHTYYTFQGSLGA